MPAQAQRMSSLLALDKEFAFCRIERGHTVRGEVRGPWEADARRATAAHAACRGGLDCRLGGRAGGGAHVEHVLHDRDAGGVEAQRLVERQRFLPRVERRACGARCELRPGSEGGRRRTTAVHEACRREGLTVQMIGQGTGRSAP